MSDLIASIEKYQSNGSSIEFKTTMKGLVYDGRGKIAFTHVSKPPIEKQTDAIVKILKTTICGTDLGILHGKTPSVKPITHHFKLDEIMKAYEVFVNATKEKAMKIILTN